MKMIKMFDDKRMELEPEDYRKLTNEGDIEKIIFWTIISVVLFCILLPFFHYILVLPYYLAIIIYNSFFNPLVFVGTAVMFIFIGVVGDFGLFMVKNFKSSKMQKIDRYNEKILISATEKKISKYLQVNIGNAYSKDALLKRVVEKAQHPNFKKYIINNGEQALNRLVEEGVILTTQKDGQSHYFTSLRDN